MNDITGLILTFNEAPNIARTLGQLSWLRDIVVVDSMSTDGTAEIAAAFPNVRIVKRTFTTHAEQWNFGLEQTGIATEWVLALDADYVLTDGLSREIQALQPDAAVSGFAALVRLLHRRAAAARRRLSASHGAVTAARVAATNRMDIPNACVSTARCGASTARIQHDDRKSSQSLDRGAGSLHGARSRQTR